MTFVMSEVVHGMTKETSRFRAVMVASIVVAFGPKLCYRSRAWFVYRTGADISNTHDIVEGFHGE